MNRIDSLRMGLATALLMVCAAGVAHATRYPPGPANQYPDTLVYVRYIQDPGELPNPVLPDTVWGIGGIITAFDAFPSGFSFYIQNRTSSAAGYTGLDIFTGGTNLQSPNPETDWPGLQLGDSVMVYGALTEFQGETEMVGLAGAFSTGSAAIRVRRISTGNALPGAHIGTVNELREDSGAEAWEGSLVRAVGSLRVARTSATGGLIPVNSFLVVDDVACSGGPCDSLFVDGSTLAIPAVTPPALGRILTFVQGIYSQRTRGYRIQVRNAEDGVPGFPVMSDAYPIYDNRLTDAGNPGAVDTVRVIFDRAVTQGSAEYVGNYSLASLGAVLGATQVAGNVVHVAIQNGLGDGDSETIHAIGLISANSSDTLETQSSRTFRNGVMTISNVQAPDPVALGGACDDRSRYAGAGTTIGPRVSVRGVCTGGISSIHFLQDQSAPTRSGVALFAPIAEMAPGRQYLVAGAVQEFFEETELLQIVYVRDEGPAPASLPSPVVQTIAVLGDPACDFKQGSSTGEDYEGMLVRVERVKIVNERAPGQSFSIAGPFGVFGDTMTVSNVNGSYTYDPDSLRIVSLNGVLRWRFDSYEIAPRDDTDFDGPVLLGIEPARGGDDGSVSVVITGSGFESGATVKLTRSGQPDVPGTQASVAADAQSLAATFDLAGKAQGSWNVVVTNPDLLTGTLSSSFTIESAAPARIRMDVIGKSLMRPNRRRAFDIVLDNQGNGDVLTLPLWINGIPSGATVEPDFAVAYPPQSGGEPDWTQAPLTFTSPGGRYLPLVIPRVPPGTSVRRIYLTVPDTVAGFVLGVALTPPWADGTVFRACLSGAGVITAPACMGSQLTAINAYLAVTPGIAAMSGIALWAKVGWQCEGSTTLPEALAKSEQVLDFMIQRLEGTAIPAGCEGPLAPSWQDTLAVGIVSAVDPNDKLGSGGSGINRQIGADQNLSYTIQFENLQTATAPAQEVVVTDVLPAELDIATLSLGPIHFGRRASGLSWSTFPTPGSKSYEGMVDLRPERDLLVRISVDLDAPTRVLRWTLTSLDPATGMPPENDLVGFLPPNVIAPEGEGSLFFFVMPRSDLSGGTAIRNRATIGFDGVTTETPEWSNILDTTAPESGVLPLGANQDSVSFTVRWQAIGSPPDLRDFSVYVSQDGGAYEEWRRFTRATADTCTRPGGHTYSFYSLARDSSNNQEAVPSSPDVQTFSRVAVEGTPVAWSLVLEGARPNPVTTDVVRVWFTLPNRERAVLEVMDVAGRRMVRSEVGSLGPGRHSVDVSNAVRAPGLYFLRLTQGGRILRARMAVIR